jgi:general stress protein 26
MSSEQKRAFDKLLSKFSFAMLVTRSRRGALRARPMAVAHRRRDDTLYFVTDGGSAKVAEALGDRQVAVTMQDGSLFLCLSAVAAVESDTSRIADFWQSAWNVWFPGGPSDPQLVLLKLIPSCAGYWDRRGLKRVALWCRAGRALAHREALDDQSLPGHGKLQPH